MFSTAFFPFGISGLISLAGLLAFAVCALYLNREKSRLYHMLTARTQHWFPVSSGPIMVDRAGKRPIAWMEIRLDDSKSTVVLRPKDRLYKQYVANTTGNTVEVTEDEVKEACVYGRHVIALRFGSGEVAPLWGKAEFESELTPPDPQVMAYSRNRRIMLRAITITAVPVTFFGVVWLFSGIL